MVLKADHSRFRGVQVRHGWFWYAGSKSKNKERSRLKQDGKDSAEKPTKYNSKPRAKDSERIIFQLNFFRRFCTKWPWQTDKQTRHTTDSKIQTYRTIKRDDKYLNINEKNIASRPVIRNIIKQWILYYMSFNSVSVSSRFNFVFHRINPRPRSLLTQPIISYKSTAQSVVCASL